MTNTDRAERLLEIHDAVAGIKRSLEDLESRPPATELEEKAHLRDLKSIARRLKVITRAANDLAEPTREDR